MATPVRDIIEKRGWTAIPGSAVGTLVDQMQQDRGKQFLYSQLPIMEELRKIRIEIDAVLGSEGEVVFPSKNIASVDVLNEDCKLLHYHDVEQVQQNTNMLFSEITVIGVEDLTDPLMYDNFTDIILRIGKVEYLTDEISPHVAGDKYLCLTIINVAQRAMRVYYDTELIYDVAVHPAPLDMFKVSFWDLKKLV